MVNRDEVYTHGYEKLDMTFIYETARVDIPIFREQIKQILNKKQ
jgi:uncharacterized protein with HEPN domain